MGSVVFTFPGTEGLAASIARLAGAEKGNFILHHFPDGESYVRVADDVRDKDVIVVCSLNEPDTKALPLYFLCRSLKDMNAASVCLVCPYLGYMRQDKQFKPGEAVTSVYFASFLSSAIDRLITVDPHLHRWSSLKEIYSVPCELLHASDLITQWIRKNVSRPLLIGPDHESSQWVADVANKAGFPFLIMEKVRAGDRSVTVNVTGVERFMDHTPVLIDDIISTAGTMIETVSRLKESDMIAPVCVGIHGIFAGNAYRELQDAGAGRIITTNTIEHETNAIDVAELIASKI